ncbi:hypothetical protein JCM33374_g2336 [Metschnikowia sp. JCM 33374]|nr:hypothetical protein JCM33374_g2336 [Metschnikowia sp. JCM 33374]
MKISVQISFSVILVASLPISPRGIQASVGNLIQPEQPHLIELQNTSSYEVAMDMVALKLQDLRYALSLQHPDQFDMGAYESIEWDVITELSRLKRSKMPEIEKAKFGELLIDASHKMECMDGIVSCITSGKCNSAEYVLDTCLRLSFEDAKKQIRYLFYHMEDLVLELRQMEVSLPEFSLEQFRLKMNAQKRIFRDIQSIDMAKWSHHLGVSKLKKKMEIIAVHFNNIEQRMRKFIGVSNGASMNGNMANSSSNMEGSGLSLSYDEIDSKLGRIQAQLSEYMNATPSHVEDLTQKIVAVKKRFEETMRDLKLSGMRVPTGCQGRVDKISYLLAILDPN